VPSAFATAGFAEWEVYTPGGHMISHSDLWKDEHGDCLRSDAQPDAGDARIFVSHLERWRYYPGHVAGLSTDGWFLFDETTETLRRFVSESRLESALTNARVDAPISGWLTGADGWREAWFPFMVWRPCRLRLGGDAEALGFTAEQVETLRRADGAFLSESECRAAMAPEWFELYRRTTWGRQCRGWASSGKSLEAEVAFLELFCRELLVPPQP